MRISRYLAFCLLLSLSACASRAPTVEQAVPSAKPVAIGKNNRFEMVQNGRRMSADEFDAWMKARGIRIVKNTSNHPPLKIQPKQRSRQR